MKIVATVSSAVALVVLMMSVLLIGDCGSGGRHDRSHASDAQALQKLFPTLEGDGVTAFRYQDWCKVISYKRGHFANTTEPSCIFMATATPNPFDEQAKTDLERIWNSVRSTRVGVFQIADLRYDPAHRLNYGVFDFSSGFVRERYVFDPGYKLPEDEPGERLHTRINDKWYHIREDWN